MGRAIIVPGCLPNSHPIKGKTEGSQESLSAANLLPYVNFRFLKPFTSGGVPMALNDGMKEDLQAISQQSEAVQRAAAALSAATARARGVRLGVVVAAVLLIGVVCVLFYGLGMSVQSPDYLDRLTKAGQK